MTSLRRITHAQELLDLPQPEWRRLEQSLDHVAQVNRWLGGNRSVISALGAAGPDTPLELLDVGTGSATLPRLLVRWARRRRIPIRVHATDLHPQILELARKACREYPEIIVEEADALRLPYANDSFTHALMTLTLHHFEGNDANTALQELVRVSRRAALVSELERCWPNYLGARFLAATWWRNNPITRHDGPLSVLRAFTPAELGGLARSAGEHPFHLRRSFFHRLVLVVEPQHRSASA